MSKLRRKIKTELSEDNCINHHWYEMHHYQPNPKGGEDIHYCPTGFKQCSKCYKVDFISDPKCDRWGI